MAGLLSNSMKMWAALFVLLTFFTFSVIGQNLVINPSFEEYSICPDFEGQYNGYVNDWVSYFSSPNYGNKCGYYPGHYEIVPYDGKGITSAIYSFHVASRREYLHGNLSRPLVAGQLYFINYFVYQFTYGVATDEYHAHLTNQIIDDNPADGVLRLTPHIQYDGDIILADSGWTSVHGCYQARGGEDRIILGNFFDDSATNSIVLSLGSSNSVLVDQVGVYLIDDLRHRPDTTLYEGDTLDFSVTDPRRYRQEGVGRLDQFIATETGCYKIYYTLPTCDFLDSFNICVIGCQEELDVNLFGNHEEQQCLELAEHIELEVADSLDVTINGETITDLDDWQPIQGVNYITVSDPMCDLMDDYTLVYAECCDEWSIDSIDCPVDTTRCQVYVPNAFSPNNDGINDYLMTFSNCDLAQYSLRIYDRYGAKVFESRSQDIGWDGYFRSKPLSPGVYVYMLTYTENRGSQIKSGDVLLIR